MPMSRPTPRASRELTYATTVSGGRIGYGYVYPDFEARISYKTPNMNGFQAEVGMYDPIEQALNGAGTGFNTNANVETDTPRFEGELTYASTFSGGSFNAWADFLWQNSQFNNRGGAPAALQGQDWDSYGAGVGGQIAASGFEATGYYYTGQNLMNAANGLKGFAPGFNLASTSLVDIDQDGWYAQGTYTFNGKTKVGFSYGESNQDSDASARQSATAGMLVQDVSREMWTIGVYHDVNSWLKLIAEYSDINNENKAPTGVKTADFEASLFSVGAFVFW